MFLNVKAARKMLVKLAPGGSRGIGDPRVGPSSRPASMRGMVRAVGLLSD